MAEADLQLALAVGCDVAEALLHVSRGVEVGQAVEHIAPALQQAHQAGRHVAAGHIQALGKVRECSPLNDWNDVRDSISYVYHEPCEKACTVQGATCQCLLVSTHQHWDNLKTWAICTQVL